MRQQPTNSQQSNAHDALLTIREESTTPIILLRMTAEHSNMQDSSNLELMDNDILNLQDAWNARLCNQDMLVVQKS